MEYLLLLNSHAFVLMDWYKCSSWYNWTTASANARGESPTITFAPGVRAKALDTNGGANDRDAVKHGLRYLSL